MKDLHTEQELLPVVVGGTEAPNATGLLLKAPNENAPEDCCGSCGCCWPNKLPPPNFT